MAEIPSVAPSSVDVIRGHGVGSTFVGITGLGAGEARAHIGL